jgi:hypothetical protein
MRLAGLCAAFVGCVVACRAVAGIKDIQYEPAPGPDGAPPDDASPDTAPPPDGPTPADAGTDACATIDATLLNVPDLLVQLDVVADQAFVSTGMGVLGFSTSGGSTPPTPVAVVPAGSPLSWGSFGVGGALVYYSLTGNPTGGADGGLVPGIIHTVHLDGTNDSPFGIATYPYLLTVAGGYLFWTDDPVQANATGTATVSLCPLGQCNSSPWITGIGHTYALFADTATLFVLANDPANPSTAATLFSCALPGTGGPCGASPRKVFSGVDATSNFSFASDGTYVYGTYAAFPGIVRVPVGGGAPTTLVDNDDMPTALTFDAVDGHVYWTTSGGSIYRARTDGSGGADLLACDLSAPGLITTDSSFVYFVAQSGAESVVQKIPKPAGG